MSSNRAKDMGIKRVKDKENSGVREMMSNRDREKRRVR